MIVPNSQVDAQVSQKEKVFGHSLTLSALNIIMSEDNDFITVDNGNGLIWKFRKGNAGYNEIWLNNSMLIANEQWTLEYLSEKNWKQRGIPQYVTWKQITSNYVIVNRFYTDYLGTTFSMEYSFFGGYSTKITMKANIGQMAVYRVVWSVSGISKTYVENSVADYKVSFWDESKNADGVVLDYSDVYASFGGVTTVNLDVSANNHKVDQNFDVGVLKVGEFVLDPTFGFTGDGTGSRTIVSDGKYLQLFPLSEDGTISEISARIFVEGGDANAKAFIYDSSEDLMATSNEVVVSTSEEYWYNFTISYEASAASYWLGVIVDTETKIRIDTGEAGNTYKAEDTYADGPEATIGTKAVDYYGAKASIYATYSTDSNTAPVNDACSIVDLDDTDNIYAQLDTYSMTVNVTDADGPEDIDTVKATIQTGGATERITYQFNKTSGVFSELSGDTTHWELVTGSCSNVSSGNTLNTTFVFKLEWDATEEAGLDVKIVTSDGTDTDTDTYDLNIDVVTNLVVSGFVCDDDRGDLSQTITFTGTVYYANNPSSSTATTFYPPDAEFTSVSVYDAANNNEGTDSSIVNGAFSIAFTSDNYVVLETYNPYLNMTDADYTDAEESPTDTYINDAVMFHIEIDDARDNIDDTITVSVNATYAYDKAAFDTSGSISLNGSAMSYVAGNYWTLGVTQSTAVQRAYQITAFTDSTYGITNVGAIDFDGSDDYVSCGNTASLNLTASLTLDIWIKPDSGLDSNLHYIMHKSDGANGYALWVYGGADLRVGFFVNGLGDADYYIISSTNKITLNAWNHLVARYDSAGTLYLTINGVTISESTAVSSVTTTTQAFEVGLRGSEKFKGKIGLAKVYNRSISTQEAYEHYQGFYNNETGLVLQFNPTSWDHTNTEWDDLSGEGNDGTVTSATVQAGGWNDTYTRPIWDGLAISDIQSPAFNDNGDFSYEAKLSYAYDSSAVNAGIIRIVHTNGTELTSNYTTNSTGYASVVLGQTNSSSAGTYTIIGNTDPDYGLTDMQANQTFVVRSWTLQARDAASTNLPRSVVFDVDVSSVDFDEWTSSTAGISTTIYAPNATAYTVTTSWGTHTVQSSSITLSANTASTIDTKIQRLTDGANYVLMSLDNTDMVTPTLLGEANILLHNVVAAGSLEFKADHLNWKVATEPTAFEAGARQYTPGSGTWTWASSIFSLTDTYVGTQDITLSFTENGGGGGGGGGGGYVPLVTPPDDGSPYDPEAPEGWQETPFLIPTQTRILDFSGAIFGVILIFLLVGGYAGYKRISKKSTEQKYHDLIDIQPKKRKNRR